MEIKIEDYNEILLDKILRYIIEHQILELDYKTIKKIIENLEKGLE